MHAHSRRSCRKSWRQPLRLLSVPAAARQAAGNAADERNILFPNKRPYCIMTEVAFSLYLLLRRHKPAFRTGAAMQCQRTSNDRLSCWGSQVKPFSISEKESGDMRQRTWIEPDAESHLWNDCLQAAGLGPVCDGCRDVRIQGPGVQYRRRCVQLQAQDGTQRPVQACSALRVAITSLDRACMERPMLHPSTAVCGLDRSCVVHMHRPLSIVHSDPDICKLSLQNAKGHRQWYWQAGKPLWQAKSG